MICREAGDADAPLIVEVLYRAFREYEGVLDPPSGVHKESVASVREKMETGHWLMAEEDGRAVGCVWYENRGEYVYLGRLAVAPEFRGRGIGDALMQAVEAGARAENVLCVRLGVRTVLEKMQGAYERRGYRVIRYETHAGYEKPTYLLMEKVLKGASKTRE